MERLKILIYLPYAMAGLFVLLGIPLALKLIKPNYWYGVRTSNTLGNPEIWYSANFKGGISFILLGILSAIIVFLLHKYWGVDTEAKLLVAVLVPALMILLAIPISLS